MIFKKGLILFTIGISMLSCKETHYQTLLFVGSFTHNKPGEGIHVYEFDSQTGEVVLKDAVDSITNTSFLKLSPNGKYLYSVVESQMPHHGKIAAFEVDAINQKVNLLNIQDCGGLNPAHLEIDSTGRVLVNSNYTDGSLSVFNISTDGRLNPANQVLKFKDSSVNVKRQKSSHIHSSNFSPDNRFLFAQDLGADKIRVFKLNEQTTGDHLQMNNPIKVTLGSGPRHFTFHPNGKFGYGLAELSGEITVFKYNDGTLSFIEKHPSYQQKQDIYSGADIHISPDGAYLYASNRGPNEDSISIFAINPVNGSLNLIGHEPTYGEHPRNFTISPDGKFLLVANQFSNTIVIFKRDLQSGKLKKLSKEIIVENPSSIQMQTYK